MPHQDSWHNGKRLVSVTELQGIISKPFLDKWKESLCSFQQGQCGFVQAKKVADEAAELANKVHEEMAEYLRYGVPVKEEWSTRIVARLIELNITKHLIEPETFIQDTDSGLQGTPDFIGKADLNPEVVRNMKEPRIFIGDYKIKKSLDPLTAMQGCGYRYLIRRKYDLDINWMLALHAKKSTKSMIVEPVWIELDPWMDDWKALVKLWNRVNKARQVNIFE